MARVWLPPQSDPWLALREPALLVPNRLPIGSAVLRADGLARGLTACLVADGGSLRDIVENVSPSVDAASGERVILGAVGPEYSGGSGVNTRFANDSRFAPVNGTGLTIAAWFDVDTLTNYSAIAAFQQTTTTDGWELRLGGAGGITGSDINWANMNSGIKTWRSGAARYSAGQRSAFIGISREGNAVDTAPLMHWGTGSVVASISVGGAFGDMTVPASREMYIGHRYDNVTRLDGAVGMLLIYDRALSAAELDALYARGPAALFEPAANEPIFIGTAAGGPSAQTINADFISSASAIFQPSVTGGAATLSADFIASASAVFEPVLSTGGAPQSINADFIASASQVFDATVSGGAATVSADFIASASQVFDASVTPGAATIAADFVASASQIFEPTLNTGATIQADFIAPASAIFQPTVSGGAATVLADFIASGSIVYQPAVTSSLQTLTADFIASNSQIYMATLSTTGGQWTPIPSAGGTWTAVPPASSTWTEV